MLKSSFAKSPVVLYQEYGGVLESIISVDDQSRTLVSSHALPPILKVVRISRPDTKFAAVAMRATILCPWCSAELQNTRTTLPHLAEREHR